MPRVHILVIAAVYTALAFTAGCGSEEPTLVLTVSPANARVSVDGYVHPGGSPHTVTFKGPGRYKLDVSSPGHKPVEMMISLESGEHLTQAVELIQDPLQIAGPDDPNAPPINLPPHYQDPLQIPEGPPNGVETFVVNVTSRPSGATVTVREPGMAYRRNVGITPVTIALLSTGATEVLVTRAGYASHSRLVVAPQDGRAVNMDVLLARKKSPNQPYPIPDPLVQVDPPPITDPGSKGYLSINSNPWTAVTIDGKAVGNTPLVNFKVPPGRHIVLMENRDLGVRRKRVVDVRPGETVRISENLN